MSFLKPDLALTGIIVFLVEMLKPLLPDTARKYLPIIAVAMGITFAVLEKMAWNVGLASAIAASGGFAVGKEIAKTIGNGQKPMPAGNEKEEYGKDISNQPPNPIPSKG